MNGFLLALCLGGVLVLAPVHASSDYQQALLRMENVSQAFVQEHNYQEQAVEPLVNESYFSRNFPSQASTAISAPDADLDALTRAMLILEANEAPLPHVRYLINYSINSDSEIPELTNHYVEITRLNMGPYVRADLLQYAQAEHVGSAADFGIGPHLSWRFVMAPVMGMRSDLSYAARKEISDEAAKQIMCFESPCVLLEEAELPSVPTQQITPNVPQAAFRLEDEQGLTTPARVVQELWTALSSDDMDPMPYQASKPQFVFVVSKNIAAQEAAILGIGAQMQVFDDAIQSRWVQRQEVLGMGIEFKQALKPR